MEVPAKVALKFNQVYSINLRIRRCPHLTVSILETEVVGLADTGASVSIIGSMDLISRFGFEILPCKLKVLTADRTPYTCKGYVNVPYRYNKTTKLIPTLVVPEIAKPLILGVDFLEAFNFQLVSLAEPRESKEESWTVAHGEGNLLYAEDYFSNEPDRVCLHLLPIEGNTENPARPDPTYTDESLEIPTIETTSNPLADPNDLKTEHQLTPGQRQVLFQVVQQLPVVENGKLGKTGLVKHAIDLIPGATPKKIPCYKWSPAVESVIDTEIERLLQLDVIEPCKEAPDFINPLLPIKKPNGKWRICLDCRRLNSMTKRDEFPIPNMVQILQRIKKARYFSVIDLTESYYQVQLEENAKSKTAFRTNKNLYRFKVMPFGLTNAPATMTRLMAQVLGHDLEPYVYVYLDDIIITSETFEEHIRLLKCVALRLTTANLTINLAKSKFCQKNIKYLGYVLSEEGLSTDVAKIKPILDYPVPRTVKEVRRVLGLAGFYQKFIKNFSEITTPITNLLKKGRKKFEWTPEADSALQKLKEALVSTPVLANPDFAKPFIIETDSSDLAVGSVLVQVQEGERRCIAYYSKKLSHTQKKYSATERECLAVLLSIENFRHFIEGTRFIVQTDAISLTFLRTMSIESKSPRISRWALKLSKYDVEYQYQRGSHNIPADALSRSLHTIQVKSQDSYLEGLKKQIEREPDRYPDFKIVNEEVFKFVTNSTLVEDSTFRWKKVIPQEDRDKIIAAVHNEAHLGFLKTLTKIRERFYWPKMATDIKRFVQKCGICKESKTPNANMQPVCGKPKLCQRPWEIISMDFLGPYPRSRKGNVWLLVICDYFSKFVVVQCLKTATAPGVCTVLKNLIFNLFGVPSVCITDNAKVFLSGLFQKTLKDYGVTHWNLAVYHPAPNPTERVNRVLVTAIRCALNKKSDHRDWDDSVHEIAREIRTNVHESTGYTPYFVNFGRNMVSSGAEYDHLRELSDGKEIGAVEIDERTTQLYKEVRENLQRAYQRYSRSYNLRANVKHTFAQGDWVYKKNIHHSDKDKGFVGKFGQKYSKARIRDVLGTNTYVLEDSEGHRISGTFHGSFLKKA